MTRSCPGGGVGRVQEEQHIRPRCQRVVGWLDNLPEKKENTDFTPEADCEEQQGGRD